MTNFAVKRGIVAASMLCLLVGSRAWAQPAASSAELEALKSMVQEVIKQNEELRKRVRELESAMPKRGQAPEAATKAPAAEPQPVAVAPEPTKDVVKSARDKIQLGGAIEVEARKNRDFHGVQSSDLLLSTAEFDFEADVVDWAKA